LTLIVEANDQLTMFCLQDVWQSTANHLKRKIWHETALETFACHQLPLQATTENQ